MCEKMSYITCQWQMCKLREDHMKMGKTVVCQCGCKKKCKVVITGLYFSDYLL